mmetsp:Transcript_31628/g.104823  ORF Transcript_31628/g.104823 Transcript_31628/m.104823 type:complete len:167 (+) Transcript_31628:89-589(+)
MRQHMCWHTTVQGRHYLQSASRKLAMREVRHHPLASILMPISCRACTSFQQEGICTPQKEKTRYCSESSCMPKNNYENYTSPSWKPPLARASVSDTTELTADAANVCTSSIRTSTLTTISLVFWRFNSIIEYTAFSPNARQASVTVLLASGTAQNKPNIAAGHIIK